MLVLLPPSETKRAGGTGAPFGAAPLRSALQFPQLDPLRDRVVDALVALAGDEDAAARVLKLSDRQRGEVADNAALRSAPTMPAVDRYTGVLFDALDAASLDARGRTWLRRHVVIHSAPFGPVGALDAIPAYRLGAGISVPGLGPQKRLWSDAVARALDEHEAPFVLDLRSEAYVALGPAPGRSMFLRVGTDGDGGVLRALNHFNKHAKGELVRRLALARPRIRSRRGFLEWADSAGLDVRESGGEHWLVNGP